AYALTGTPQIDIPMELNPRDHRHWPFLGSVVDYVHRNGPAAGRRPRGAPDNIALPFAFSSQRVGEVPRAGPYAAFLGAAYNPIWTTFTGKATRSVVKTLQQQKQDVWDPYLGITPESRFEMGAAAEQPAEITIDRLDQRRSLLRQFEAACKDLSQTPAGQSGDRYRDMAFSLMNSEQMRGA